METKRRVIEIPSEGINRYLPIYADDKKFITSHSFNEGKHFFVAKVFDHPFHSPQPAHLTREHVVVLVSQGLCVAIGNEAQFNPDIKFSEEAFIRALITEKASVRSFDIKYSRYIPSEETTEFNIVIDQISEIREYYLFDFSYRFPLGVFGKARAVVSLQQALTEIPQAFL